MGRWEDNTMHSCCYMYIPLLCCTLLQSLHLKDSLEILVVDEADLVFSYGYEDDIKAVLRYGNLITRMFPSSSWVENALYSVNVL